MVTVRTSLDSTSLRSGRTGRPAATLVLLSLPFLCGGVVAVVLALRAGAPPAEDGWIAVAVAGFVAVLGALMLAGGIQAMRASRRSSALRTARPDQPWTWRADWARGRAEGEGGGSVASAWFGCVIWNAVSWPCAWFVVPTARREPAAWMVAIFPVVGMALAVWAVRTTLRRARFGRTAVRLDTVPAPLGRKLRGAIEARLPARPPAGIHLTLGCVNRVTTGSGKSRSSFEHILWQDDHTVSTADLAIGPGQTMSVPVDFDLPRDQRATDGSNPASTIRWLLRAQASLPGIDLDEVYEVPVFATAESPTLEEWAASAGRQEARQLEPPYQRTAVVSTTATGAVAYDFGAARNPSMAAGVTLFAMAFGAVECLIVAKGAPALFLVVFGLATALLVGSAIRLWFTRSRILVAEDRLTAESWTLGIHRSRTWSREQLRHVGSRIGMQSGQGGRGVPYYDIVVGDPSGRDRVVASGLRDHHEAEWIVQQLRGALQLPPELRSAPLVPASGSWPMS